MKLEHFRTERDGKAEWAFGKLYVKPSTTYDAGPVAESLRSADQAELSACTVEPAVRVLINGIRTSSPCFTVRTRDEDRPCGIFGASESHNPQSGVVWLLGTDDLTRHGKEFIRYSRLWLNELHKHYRLLYNVIDARNKTHIRWVKWMGFDFHQDIPKYGIERRHFKFFRHYE